MEMIAECDFDDDMVCALSGTTRIIFVLGSPTMFGGLELLYICDNSGDEDGYLGDRRVSWMNYDNCALFSYDKIDLITVVESR